MKKLMNKVGSLILIVALFTTTAVVGFAGETKRFDSTGTYEGKPISSISISNIIKKNTTTILGLDKITKESGGIIICEAFDCEAPVEIKNLNIIDFFYITQAEIKNGELVAKYPLEDEDMYDMNKIFRDIKVDAKWESPEELMGLHAGGTFTITKPGIYEVIAHSSTDTSTVRKYLIVKEKGEDVKSEEDSKVEENKVEAPQTATAKSTKSTVLVNAKEQNFEAYNIGGNNFFKLRDLAQVVSGTDKQFEVTWDNANKAINLVSAKAYTPVGGELTKGDGTDKNAKLSASPIYKDGKIVELTAYNINGNNYFKLRDLAKAFNIGVTYDAKTKNVGIDTGANYTE